MTSREPLWDQPNLAEEVEDGRHYLPDAPTGGRETIVTCAIEAQPQYVIQMPGPGWSHVLWPPSFTAAFFLLLTVKLVVDRDRLRRARDRLLPRLGCGSSIPARPRARSTSAAAFGCRPT